MSRQDGNSALMIAAGKGKIDIVSYLLDKRANIDFQNKASFI
jgi:hypothetical protein